MKILADIPDLKITDFHDPQKPPESVIILGMGPSERAFWQGNITQDRKDLQAQEVWTVNQQSFCYQPDVVFWMDDIYEQNAKFPFLIHDLNRVTQKLNIPMITPKRIPELVRNSVEYPIESMAEMSRRFFGKVYFNNTIAYQIAYALWLNVPTVKIFGADFTYKDRPFAETGRACVEAWMSLLLAHNRRVILPEMTSLWNYHDGPYTCYGYHLPELQKKLGELPNEPEQLATHVPGDSGLRPEQHERPPALATPQPLPGLRNLGGSERAEVPDSSPDAGGGGAGPVQAAADLSGIRGQGTPEPGRSQASRANGGADHEHRPDAGSEGDLRAGRGKGPAIPVG